MKNWFFVDLPSLDYEKAWDLQACLVDGRESQVIAHDVLLLLEHPSVFTLGRRGGSKHMKMPKDFLAKRGIPVIQIERGGGITYHGPGQLVGYPIIDLGRSRLGIAEYVARLEEIMIRVSADWGIPAGRDKRGRGVWVENKKMGSIGIALRRGVSFHGFALNVNTVLEPFFWINPCGMEDVQITSMQEILGRDLPMEKIRHSVRTHTEEIFDVQLKQTNLEHLLPSRTRKTKPHKQ